MSNDQEQLGVGGGGGLENPNYCNNLINKTLICACVIFYLLNMTFRQNYQINISSLFAREFKSIIINLSQNVLLYKRN